MTAMDGFWSRMTCWSVVVLLRRLGGGALRVDQHTASLEVVGVNAVIFLIDGSGEPSCDSPLQASGATEVSSHLRWIETTIETEDVVPEPEGDAETDDDAFEDSGLTESETFGPLNTSVPDQLEAEGCAYLPAAARWWMGAIDCPGGMASMTVLSRK